MYDFLLMVKTYILLITALAVLMAKLLDLIFYSYHSFKIVYYGKQSRKSGR